VPLLSCAVFYRFAISRCEKKSSAGQSRRVLGQGQPRQLVLCCLLVGARALGSQAGVWGRGKAYV